MPHLSDKLPDPQGGQGTRLAAYMKEIRNGQATDNRGRPITTTTTTRFYAYLVCDLTSELRERLADQGFISCPDGNSYFKHLESTQDGRFEYFEYISLDKLLNDAEKRNLSVFHKLGVVALPQS
jgi:hypothetical protein